MYVDPTKANLKAHGTQCLKLIFDVLLPSVAFNSNLRLSHLERRRDMLVKEVAAVEEEQAAQLAAAGGYNPFDRLDDLLTREALEAGAYTR